MSESKGNEFRFSSPQDHILAVRSMALRHKMAQSVTRDSFVRFLDLPRELRDLVYTHAIKALPPLVPNHFTLSRRPSKPKNPADLFQNAKEVQYGRSDLSCCALLFVSKQVSQESMPVFQSHARVLLRLTQQETCSHIHIATSAMMTEADTLKTYLTNTLLNLIINHKNFVLKLDAKDMKGSGINDSNTAPAHKWNWALRELLTWTYGTRPITPQNAKHVRIHVAKASIRNPNKLGLSELPEILKQVADVAAGIIVVDANVSTADILDNEYRRRALEAFQHLNECRHLGVDVTLSQH